MRKSTVIRTIALSVLLLCSSSGVALADDWWRPIAEQTAATVGPQSAHQDGSGVTVICDGTDGVVSSNVGGESSNAGVNVATRSNVVVARNIESSGSTQTATARQNVTIRQTNGQNQEILASDTCVEGR